MMLLDIVLDLVIELNQAIHCDCDGDGFEDDNLLGPDCISFIPSYKARGDASYIPKYAQMPGSLIPRSICRWLGRARRQ